MIIAAGIKDAWFFSWNGICVIESGIAEIFSIGGPYKSLMLHKLENKIMQTGAMHKNEIDALTNKHNAAMTEKA